MRSELAVLAMLAVGCGRIGFDGVERGSPGDGPGPGIDAPATDDATDAAALIATDFIVPSVVGDNDHFGAKIAISADGSTLAVGAYGEASNAVGINGDATNNAANLSGAVYVYTRAGANWVQQAFIKASNTESGDVFGWSVALSANGSVLAVGAPDEASASTVIGVGQADNSAALAGAVYVFRRAGATWSQDAYIKPSNLEAGDSFGETVALSDDGLVLAVGAIREDGAGTGATGNPASNAAIDSGAVYVFVRGATVWAQESYLKASNTGAGDIFGIAIALSGDGSRLAVSATAEASGATGIDGNQLDNSQGQSGAVYVFAHNVATWVQEAYVKASNTDGGDFFGFSVALSRDGRTLAVSAEGEDGASTGVGGPEVEGAGQAGAAYVFTRGATPPWTQQVYIKATNAAVDDRFGRSIALSADGGRLVVGAPQEDSAATDLGGDQSDDSASDSGAAYVYERGGSTWTATEYIKATNTVSGDAFGASVAMSASGGAIAVGAHARSTARGAVYVIE